MLTRLTIRNFKCWQEAEIELGNPVVFVGPNDSGKTSALQALALWDLGLRRWVERHGDSAPEQRPGVTVNRRDLAALPAPSARQFWRELEVRRTYRDPEDRQRTENIRIDVVVDGYDTGPPDFGAVSHEGHSGDAAASAGETAAATLGSSDPVGAPAPASPPWECGLEFDFANPEIFYCRPLRVTPDGSERMPVPEAALHSRVVLLGPMSGLAVNETRLEPGAISVRLGEGRTAEVLRNLCHQVFVQPGGRDRWKELAERLAALFGVRLDEPRLIVERGEIELTYRTPAGSRLDLTGAGRGMQQTLLLLSFIELHPGSVVLLDEPDAHLEILRQRQTFDLLSEAASERGTQIIVASHSEVILKEAAERGTVVAFVGSPHRLNKSEEVVKSLKDIGFDQYYQAEATGFVLYLEWSTDLSILRAFAELIDHDAAETLECPFVHVVRNHVQAASRHFYGLREAKRDLVGFALFDRLERKLPPEGDGLVLRQWSRREIENYLVPSRSLRRYARDRGAGVFPPDSLFAEKEAKRWEAGMERALADQVPPAAFRDEDAPYWANTKISDDLLSPVLAMFFKEMGSPHLMYKANYHRLVPFLEPSEVHPEVVEVLDAIVVQHSGATPAT